MADGQSGLLRGFRVLDLATRRAEYAGRVFADLGAEVIKVEPPSGAEARHMPPFDERDGSDGVSLYWAAAALGKKSCVIDLESEAGRDDLRRLAETADVFIESFDPGALGAVGLGYDDLRTLNPTLVFVSVTPYGQDGPDAHSPASDLTLQAAGGLLSLQGDPDRPPVPVGYPQAGFHAGVQAAADAILALYERARSGRGQHLDVSMQAGVVWTLMNATGYPPNEHADPPAASDERSAPLPELLPGVPRPPALWQGAEGPFTCAAALGAMGARTLDLLSRWAEEEGARPADLEGISLLNWAVDVSSGALAPARLAAAYEALYAFLATKTNDELMERATRDSLLLSPIFRIDEVVKDPQLAAREYWREIGGRKHPGPFAHPRQRPLTLDQPAPALGADQSFATAPQRDRHLVGHDRRPKKGIFEGLKVADFAWVGAGPLVTRALADHGATVVHVETASRPDVLRLFPPFKDGQPGVDNAQFMANFNSSKLGIAVDLSTDDGRKVARRLVDWADVVMESFTPGVLAKYGLDYDTISKDRPELVMMSSCLRGQTGPQNTYTGFGGQGAALAGIHGITGWPDRDPAGPWGAYTDFIAPRYSLAALAAALVNRESTGEGQYIDLSQVEAGIHFIEPLFLDYTVNGRLAGPQGMASPTAAPNGVYATQGTERYVAISVETPAQWEALTALVPGLGAFAGEEFSALERRRSVNGAIDSVIADWCRGHDAFELAGRLKEAGVPASAVLRPSDLYDDAQLAHRGFFVTLDHSFMGPTPYDGLVTHFSELPGKLRKAAPCLGEDTHSVLTELLGYTDDEVVALAGSGALS